MLRGRLFCKPPPPQARTTDTQWLWKGRGTASLSHPAHLCWEEREVLRDEVVVVAWRSRLDTSSADVDALFDHCGSAESNIEHVRISVSPRSVTFSTGVSALFPFYVWLDGESVGFSWDLKDSYDQRTVSLNRPVALRYLELASTYSAATLVSGVYRLTERSSIIATESGLSIVEPSPPQAFAVREVLPGAPIAQALLDVLQYSIINNSNGQPLVLELSGGFDSSCVVAAAPDEVRATFGLLFEGLAGKNQQRRRLSLLAQRGFTDFALDIRTSTDPDEWLAGACTHDPELDFYGSLTLQAIKRLELDTPSVVVTGMGGDEALLAPPDHLPSEIIARLPIDATRARSRLPESGLQAACSRFLFFVDAGHWPSHPYLTSEAYEFAERIPPNLLKGRALQREALVKVGLPRALLQRPVSENFSAVLHHLARTLLPRLDLDRLLVTRLGVADHAKTATLAAAPSWSDSEASQLLRVIVMEEFLRKLIQEEYN